jgi:CubicO group peptidase (beta-lactamase class C family)
MRSFFYITLLLQSVFFLFSGNAQAQEVKQINDSLFEEVKHVINIQDSEKLYSFFNEDFRKHLPKDGLFAMLRDHIYPLGTIKQSEQLSYSDNVSSYMAVFEKGSFMFKIASDTARKISTLLLQPYRGKVTLKDYTVPSNNPMQTDCDRHADTIARKYINKVSTVGLSIGIWKDGKENTYGYGTTQKGKNMIPDAQAIFEIGSVTKTFTATLLAWYVEQGKLRLNDPITKYLPDSVAGNTALQGITLQMLANHTSGIPRLPSNLLLDKVDFRNPYKDYDKAMLYAYLKGFKATSAPGAKYEYSNAGAGLLGDILEHVSGKTYARMLQEVICGPLKLHNTYIHADEAQKGKEVSVYNDKTTQGVMWDMNALMGAGGIRSDVHDMLLYVSANMNSNTASALARAMQLTQQITYSKEVSVGLGWHKTEIKGNVCYWHNGGTGGCRSYVAFVPARRIAVVLLANSMESLDEAGPALVAALQ